MSRPVAHVLLVEDNELDVRMVLRAAEKAKIRNTIEVAADGDAAMTRLRCVGEFAESPAIDLVLLDLNLPGGLDGLDILRLMKDDPELAPIPVVILTTSSDNADMLHAYRSHAAAFITKPVGIEGFVEVVQAVEHFWVEIVRLPS